MVFQRKYATVQVMQLLLLVKTKHFNRNKLVENTVEIFYDK